jgi:hypothetical protein
MSCNVDVFKKEMEGFLSSPVVKGKLGALVKGKKGTTTKEVKDTVDKFAYNLRQLQPPKEGMVDVKPIVKAKEVKETKVDEGGVDEGRSPESKLGSVVAATKDMINANSPTVDGVSVVVEDIVKVDDGYSVRFTRSTTGRTVTRKLRGKAFIQLDGVDFQVTSEELDNLGSDKDFLNRGYEEYEVVARDLISNPDKIMELAEEVDKLDPTDTGEWHKATLLDNLSGIVAPLVSLMPDVTVHLGRTTRNGGMVKFDGNKADVYVGLGPRDTNRSALEAYTHELYHVVTAYALNSRDPAIASVRRRIVAIKNSFLSMTPEELSKYMDKPDLVQAQADLDYFADTAVGLHEFIAFARTNKATMKALADRRTNRVTTDETNLVTKLIGYVRELFDRLVVWNRKIPTGSDYQEMAWLVARLAETNKKQVVRKREGILGKLIGQFNKAEDNLATRIDKMKDKAGKRQDTSKLVGGGVVKQGYHIVATIAKSLVSQEAKRTIQFLSSTTGVKSLKPEGTLWSTIRDMSESDDYQDMIEQLGYYSNQIDQHRALTRLDKIQMIKSGFTRKLDVDEENSLTSIVVDIDLGTIAYDYDVVDLIKYPNRLKQEIKNLEDKLKGETDKRSYNYYIAQIDGLARYMVDGDGGIVQMTNAKNIVDRVSVEGVRYPDNTKELVDIVDTLATLRGLQVSSKTDKDIFLDLMENEKSGVEQVVAYQVAHKEMSEKELFTTHADKRRIIKGYSKPVLDQNIEGTTAPIADEKRMKRLGYKLSHKVPRYSLDASEGELGYYVSSLQVTQTFHRVALRTTGKNTRGTSVTGKVGLDGDNVVERVKADKLIRAINVRAEEIVREMEAGTYVATADDKLLSPKLNNSGRIVGYSYNMSKKNKVKILKMDRRVSNVIGSMYASTYDKMESSTFNKELLKYVKEDADKNKSKKHMMGKLNSMEYVTLDGKSNDKELNELWGLVPTEIKLEFKDGITLRRDMLHSIMGYRELGLSDVPGGKILPEGMNYGLRVAEKVWKEIVKVAKVDVILRTPTVLVGNVVSNLMYSVMTGHSPVEIAKLQLQGVRDLNDFISSQKEVIRLKGKEKAGLASSVEIRRLSALEGDIKSSPVKDLIDGGFYTSIVEELDIGEGDNSSMFTDILDDRLKGAPTIVRDGVNLLYLNEKTSVFKMMSTATQYSDFVARYAQYHLMLRKGISKDKALKTVRDAFINYNKPNSRLVEWFNQMGFIMFTKYFTRIQKAIAELAKGHPAKLLIAILGQEYIVGDVEDVTDQSMITKNLGGMVYNPFETLVRAITPSGLEALTYPIR